MSTPDWPDLPADWLNDEKTRTKYRELILAAQVDITKTAAQAQPSPRKSLADDDSEKKLHETLSKLVSDSIERGRDGAKFVETAAAAVGTVYTGILAFSFAADETPLPGRALYAAIFLGIAIVGAAYYLAFIKHIKPIGRVDYQGSRPEDQWRRTEYLGAWTRAVTQSRASALRAAVFALAFGVMFMPFAFLPDKLPNSALALLDTETAEPTSTASPSWPPPPLTGQDPAIDAVLYKAQLDDFVASKSKSATAVNQTGGISTNTVALVLALIGLVIVALVASWESLRTFKRWLIGDGRRQPGAG